MPGRKWQHARLSPTTVYAPRSVLCSSAVDLCRGAELHLPPFHCLHAKRSDNRRTMPIRERPSRDVRRCLTMIGRTSMGKNRDVRDMRNLRNLRHWWRQAAMAAIVAMMGAAGSVSCGNSSASHDAGSDSAGSGGSSSGGSGGGTAGAGGSLAGAGGNIGSGGTAGAGSGGVGAGGSAGVGAGGSTGSGGQAGAVGGAGGNGSGGQGGASGAAVCSSAPPVPCTGGEICDLDTPNRCVAGYQPGHCIVLPAVCPALVAPVCGCDNQTYNNDCERQRARAQLAHAGSCP